MKVKNGMEQESMSKIIMQNMQQKRQYRISPNLKHNNNQEMNTEQKKDSMLI